MIHFFIYAFALLGSYVFAAVEFSAAGILSVGVHAFVVTFALLSSYVFAAVVFTASSCLSVTFGVPAVALSMFG